MRKKMILSLATTILIMLVSESYAATVAELWTFWKTRQSRQHQAREWRDGFMKLDEQIPTLSPAEQRWLRTEYDEELRKTDGHFTNRAINALNSKEFDVRVAKQSVEEVIRLLSELSGPTLSDQKTEVILWAQLASLFMDFAFWQAIDGLIQRDVIDKRLEINGNKESSLFRGGFFIPTTLL